MLEQRLKDNSELLASIDTKLSVLISTLENLSPQSQQPVLISALEAVSDQEVTADDCQPEETPAKKPEPKTEETKPELKRETVLAALGKLRDLSKEDCKALIVEFAGEPAFSGVKKSDWAEIMRRADVRVNQLNAEAF